MRYQLTTIFCRPWTLNGLSLQLIESHYENNYGSALRRLNAIAEKLDSLDFANTPAYIVNSLKCEGLIALNSTLPHELYFASLAFGDGRPRCSPGRLAPISGRWTAGAMSSSPWRTARRPDPAGYCSSTFREIAGS